MKTESLIGTWTFVSCVAKSSNGEIHYPWGKDSTGYLNYTPDGYVFVSRMGAQSEFESYCGRYVVQDDAVIHQIKHCSSPEYIGTSQKRFFSFMEDELHLTTAPVEDKGVTHTASLVWKRAIR